MNEDKLADVLKELRKGIEKLNDSIAALKDDIKKREG